MNKEAMIRKSMIDQVRVGLSTYIKSYVEGLFDRPHSSRANDILCEAFAEAIFEYERKTGKKIARNLATYLLDNSKESV